MYIYIHIIHMSYRNLICNANVDVSDSLFCEMFKPESAPGLLYMDSYGLFKKEIRRFPHYDSYGRFKKEIQRSPHWPVGLVWSVDPVWPVGRFNKEIRRFPELQFRARQSQVLLISLQYVCYAIKCIMYSYIICHLLSYFLYKQLWKFQSYHI